MGKDDAVRLIFSFRFSSLIIPTPRFYCHTLYVHLRAHGENPLYLLLPTCELALSRWFCKCNCLYFDRTSFCSSAMYHTDFLDFPSSLSRTRPISFHEFLLRFFSSNRFLTFRESTTLSSSLSNLP